MGPVSRALAACLLASVPAGVRAAPALQLHGSYVVEALGNVSGGDIARLRASGQLALGASARVLDGPLGPGTFQVTMTARHGRHLADDAGLGVLMPVQENFGRGRTVRLTQLWYEGALADGGASLKLGRVTVGEDFAAEPCDFTNLTFCGSYPADIVSDYWYNFPVSQWGTRLRVGGDRVQLQIGAYEVNPENLDEGFFLTRTHGATGVLTPVELSARLPLGPGGRRGVYKVGAWRDSSRAPDVATGPTFGAVVREVRGRHGIWAQARQRLTGHDGPVPRGVSVFANIARSDRRTSTLDRHLAAGLVWDDPLGRAAADQWGVAIGATRINPRTAGPGRPRGEEKVAEAYARYAVTDRLQLQPGVQVIRPPRSAQRQSAILIGLRANIRLN